MKGPEPVVSQIIDKLKHINQVCGTSNKNANGEEMRDGQCPLFQLYSWPFGEAVIVHFLRRFSLLQRTSAPCF